MFCIYAYISYTFSITQALERVRHDLPPDFERELTKLIDLLNGSNLDEVQELGVTLHRDAIHAYFAGDNPQAIIDTTTNLIMGMLENKFTNAGHAIISPIGDGQEVAQIQQEALF